MTQDDWKNPYHSHPQTSSTATNAIRDTAPLGMWLLTGVMTLAFILGIASMFIPWLNAWTIPRFGWIGLILCANPLIFLVISVRHPARRSYAAAASMSLVLGLINALTLMLTGTVDKVQNIFSDRLHSAWLWSVVPMLLMTAYLAYLAWSFRSNEVPTDGNL
ncbi:MAG: hypothetical protein WCI02_03700 [Planctomycetota bacterium]|jgi:hypothetical protein